MTRVGDLQVPVWWTNGSMMYRRDCLPPNHPEHTYNYMKNVMKVVPEDYGIERPTPPPGERCPTCHQTVSHMDMGDEWYGN